MNSWDYDERKPYLAYTNDGLIEMVLGSTLLMAVLMMQTDLIYMGAIWVVLILPLVWSLKRWITVPRLTAAEVASVDIDRAKRLRIFAILALTALVIGGAFVFATFFSESTLGQYARIFWSSLSFLILVGLIAAMGYFLDQKRWYAYAALTVFMAVLVTWFNVPFPLALVTIGGAILAVGLVLLVRFLSTHPRLPDSEHPAV